MLVCLYVCIYACMCVYIYMFKSPKLHTPRASYVYTNAEVGLCSIHTYVHTPQDKKPHVHILTCTNTCMHACIRTYIHTYIHTYIRETEANYPKIKSRDGIAAGGMRIAIEVTEIVKRHSSLKEISLVGDRCAHLSVYVCIYVWMNEFVCVCL